MVGFYKHDIPAWMDGTEALSDGAYRAYHVIVQLIMLTEGPIARNDRGIAGRCNQTLKTYSRNLAELIAAGKIQVVDGKLDNGRAASELVAIRANRANASKGGKISRKSEKISENLEKTPADLKKIQESSKVHATNSLKNNDPIQAPLKDGVSLKEERREDSPIVPKGTDPEGFAEFWQAYPKRDGDNSRKTAIRAYSKVIGRDVTPAAILSAVRAHAADMRAKGKLGTELVPMASTWLNQGRFERFTNAPEAHSEAVQADPTTRLAKVPEDEWRARVRTWKSRCGYWPWQQLTPTPDDPRTKVPAHVLAEFGIDHGGSGRPSLRLVAAA
ncbi:YdaU family protein [Methylobacterium sp. J-059]|uniref:DUF1376 domain-containing protein n=1 Tax=Methylobacterium sp. J-059 TaxID=2836643 RepID=UPI001FBA5A8E|nr:DUF1376 domain-containing protein [Methylobacterium sp. J-059]MCJ2041029.1 YdaU family protein [Methylobacterium sp. J-059]